MSVKHNEPKFTDPATMACRGAVEHRATWMALLYEQAKEQGADAEKMCREANPQVRPYPWRQHV